MARTVFILGAGASREGGAPVMADFLDTAEELLRLGKVNAVREQFELVLRARDALQVVHVKAILNITNLESVFGAFEMARILRRCGDLDPKDIERLPGAMRKLIAATLEQSLNFRAAKGQVLPPHPYDQFTTLLTDALNSRAGNVAVITFNYDLGLDYAFHFAGLPVDYGLEDSDTPKSNAIPYLKLHGSGNWVLCQQCKIPQVLPLGDFFGRLRYGWNLHFLDDSKPEHTVRLNIEEALAKLQHCDQACAAEALIVPPTWNKSQYHEVIENVWRRAAKEMSEAENIVVIGYSLPKTDLFFHYLYSLGCVGGRLLRRFLVYDPKSDVERNFRELLAPGVQDGFEFLRGTFSGSLPDMRERLSIRNT